MVGAIRSVVGFPAIEMRGGDLSVNAQLQRCFTARPLRRCCWHCPQGVNADIGANVLHLPGWQGCLQSSSCRSRASASTRHPPVFHPSARANTSPRLMAYKENNIMSVSSKLQRQYIDVDRIVAVERSFV